MLTHLYTDEGMPDSYRHMDGFGVHAFKFINAKGEVHYVKFHWKSEQGIQGIRPQDIPTFDRQGLEPDDGRSLRRAEGRQSIRSGICTSR